MTELRVVVK